jgi:hypothetical protein
MLSRRIGSACRQTDDLSKTTANDVGVDYCR